jgi:hypothetical protein
MPSGGSATAVPTIRRSDESGAISRFSGVFIAFVVGTCVLWT